MKILALIPLIATASFAAWQQEDEPIIQDMPQPAQATDQHEWLQQLVGEWKVSAEAFMGPEAEPMLMESTEKVRAVGDFWIHSEMSGDMVGMPFTAILTIGYESRDERFVGTWIDTMQDWMWVYEGRLDDERKVLTLETEGPSFTQPGELAQYRETIEIVGPDERNWTSSVLTDGEWFAFMRSAAKRK